MSVFVCRIPVLAVISKFSPVRKQMLHAETIIHVPPIDRDKIKSNQKLLCVLKGSR